MIGDWSYQQNLKNESVAIKDLKAQDLIEYHHGVTDGDSRDEHRISQKQANKPTKTDF